MKCPNCSGTLYFDINSQKLKCRSCSSVFEVDEYDHDNDAEEAIIEGMRLYTCKNCGAQLISGNDEAVSYCSYCGSEAVLESEITGVKRPKYIIPFKINKARCKRIYEDKLKGMFYVPKEFKDPEFIDRFRPFYIPYWMYKVSFRNDPFDIKGHRSYTRGGYDHYEEYQITARIKNDGVYGVPYDASRNFDDSIAEQIAPFNKKDLVKYRQGYLAGMYADAPNVDAQLYKDEVVDKATDVAVTDLKDDLGGITPVLPHRKKKIREFLGAEYYGEDTIFLPVWFLTWRKGKRVAYAVVNGQNGYIHIDLPADMKTFMMYTAAGAGLLFMLLTLFVSVTSRFIIWFSALLLYLVGVRYHKELREIRNRENHVFDKGYLLNDGDRLPMSEKRRSYLRRKLKSSGSILRTVIYSSLLIFFFIIFACTGELYDLMVSQTGAIALTFVVLVMEFVRFIKQISVARFLRNKRSLLICFLGLGAIVYAFFVASLQPVEDWWYYLGGLICLLAACAMSADLISRYNETSTRPLPSFYERKGGNDHA